jgi:hypothetical protein
MPGSKRVGPVVRAVNSPRRRAGPRRS